MQLLKEIYQQCKRIDIHFCCNYEENNLLLDKFP